MSQEEKNIIACLSSTPPEFLGKQIQTFREAALMNQTELGSKVGVSRQTISNYENGRVEHLLKKQSLIKKIADALKIDLFDLISTK